MPLNLIGIARHYTENVPTLCFHLQSSDTAELVTDDPCRI